MVATSTPQRNARGCRSRRQRTRRRNETMGRDRVHLGRVWDPPDAVEVSKLSEWRGVYFIFDTLDGKGYVGSAYGESNLLGRWLNYAASGHGGNRLLRQRDPRTFQFTILQRVSPDLDATAVVQLEGSWKRRLHTYAPYGLNDN